MGQSTVKPRSVTPPSALPGKGGCCPASVSDFCCRRRCVITNVYANLDSLRASPTKAVHDGPLSRGGGGISSAEIARASEGSMIGMPSRTG